MKYVCILGWCAGFALAARFPNQSFLGFIGWLLFWGFTLALLGLFVRFVVRRLKSGTWSTKRVLIGGIGLVLALFVFQRLIAPGDRTQIEETIETVATSTDPSYCDDKVTQRYLQQATGAKAPFADEVCESEAETKTVDDVDVSEIVVDGDRATAVVSYRGGPIDGSRLVVRLVEEGGDWKLDRRAGFAHFDRAKFDRAYRRLFLEFGSPSNAADCALARERRLSDNEIQQMVLTFADRAFTAIAVECDREGMERNLATAVADADFDFPPRGIECAEHKIRSLTDRELVELRVDLVAFGKLLFKCDRAAVFGYLKRELGEDDLDLEAVHCVLETFRKLRPAGIVRLTYDQDRYGAVVKDCEE